MDRLGVIPPDSRPHATQFIDGMIEIIKELVDVGAAYVVPEKGVYFSVADLAEYGHLAGRTLDQLLEDAGQRVDVDEDKKSPLDFALWKSAKPNTDLLVSLKPSENDLRFKEHLRRRPSTVSVPPAVAEAEDKLDIVAGCYVRKL